MTGWAQAWTALAGRRGRAVVVMMIMTFGASGLLITLSFLDGLLESYRSGILKGAPHMIVTPLPVGGVRADLLVDENDEVVEMKRSFVREREERIRNAMSQMRMIERELGDEVAGASPFLETRTLAVYGVNEVALQVRGVIPSREAEFSDLNRYMEEGSIGRFANYRNGILLGYRAAERLGVHANDRIRLVALDGTPVPVQIAGVYRFDIPSRDEGCLAGLRLATSLAGTLPGEANGIGLKIGDPDRVNDAARKVEQLTGLRTETWKETHADSLSVFTLLRVLALLPSGLLIVIGALGIGRLVMIARFEHAMETRSSNAPIDGMSRIPRAQGVLLSVVSASVGIVIGVVAIPIMNGGPFPATLLPVPFDVGEVQMRWNPWHLPIVFLIAVAIGALATIRRSRTIDRSIPQRQ